MINQHSFVTISDSWVKDQETHQEIHWVFISLWLLWFDVFGHNICQQEIVVDICMGNNLVLKNLASIWLIFVFNTLHPSPNITIWQKEEKTLQRNCFCLFSWWLEPILHTCTCKLNNETQPYNKMCLVKLKTFQKREAVHVILKSSKQWVFETITKQLLLWFTHYNTLENFGLGSSSCISSWWFFFKTIDLIHGGLWSLLRLYN